MDPATATIVAAAISATASVAVAIITTRARITIPKAENPANQSVEQKKTDNSTSAPGTASARKNRTVGWVLVGFLYFMSVVFLTLFGVFLKMKSPTEPIDGILVGWGCLVGAVLFSIIGRWAQRRLSGAINRIEPQSIVGAAKI